MNAARKHMLCPVARGKGGGPGGVRERTRGVRGRARRGSNKGVRGRARRGRNRGVRGRARGRGTGV